jgi:hypothetical protein
MTLLASLSVACSGATSGGDASGGATSAGGAIGTSGGQGAAGSAATTGGSVNASGGSASGGSASGGSASGGSASGGSRGGSANAGGPGVLSCKGEFGALREHFSLTDGSELSGPTVSANELELFYAQSSASSGDWQFFRAVRASKSDPFQPGAVVPELKAVCSGELRRAGSLSADGLKLYFACHTTASSLVAAPADLRVARRSALGQPFVVDAMTYGLVGLSPAISHDELELYHTGVTTDESELPPLQRHLRSNVNEPFGPATLVPGLESVFGTAPDPSPDGLELLFYFGGGLAAAYRSTVSQNFGIPVPFAALQQMQSTVIGAPEISQDCRTVYATRTGPIAGVTSFTIVSATRP